MCLVEYFQIIVNHVFELNVVVSVGKIIKNESI